MASSSQSHLALPLRRQYLATGALSAGILLQEVVLTRLFSILIWYHFAFLIVSSAILGLSLAGLVLVWRGPRERGTAFYRRCALGFAWSALVVMAIACRIEVPAFDLVQYQHGYFLALARFLGAVSLGLAIPFLCAGLYLAEWFREHRDRIGASYACNLFGSGLGCLLAVAALETVGGQAAFIASALLGVLAAALLTPPKSRPALSTVLSAALLIAGMFFASKVFPLESTKAFAQKPEDVLGRQWNSFSRVEFFKDVKHWSLWGLSPEFQGDPPEQIGITIDSWALTSIVRGDRPSKQLEFIPYLPATLAHHVVHKPDTLVIGAGGGLDVVSALHFGARHIDSVELNPLIVKALRGRFFEFSGGLINQPEVNYTVGEGRNYLETSAKQWDLIQLSGVDTLTATQAGAFSLSENYLYTREAFRQYLSHLRPGGILTLTRWFLPPPVQTFRLLVLARKTLEDVGVQRPSQCVMLARSAQFSVILIRKEPYTNAECAVIANACRTYGFTLLYLPDYPPGFDPPQDEPSKLVREILTGNDLENFIQNFPYDISAPTDNRPFFMEHHRAGRLFKLVQDPSNWLGGQAVLFGMLQQLLLFSLLLFAVPLLRWRKGAGRSQQLLPVLGYFGCIGVGFMLVEMVAIQRLILVLGHPVYSLVVVLFTLLAASSLGSALSTRLSDRWRGGAQALLALAGLGTYHFLWHLAPHLLSYGAVVRFAGSALLLVPLGMFLGLWFPLGIRGLSGEPRAIAWAWAVNGWASVLGAVLAAILAIGMGFTAVFLVAIVCYLAAAGCLAVLAPQKGQQEE